MPSFVRNGNFVINTCYVGGGLTTTPTVQINLQEQFSRPSALLSSAGTALSTTGIDWSTEGCDVVTGDTIGLV